MSAARVWGSFQRPDKGGARAPLRFDEHGFLLDTESWTEASGQIIADMDGVGPLGNSHWSVIHYVRDRFLRIGAIPSMRRICRASALSRHDMKQLFGGCRQVWRIAGLPNPGEEARSYMN